jgi:hypothetical protein
MIVFMIKFTNLLQIYLVIVFLNFSILSFCVLLGVKHKFEYSIIGIKKVLYNLKNTLPLRLWQMNFNKLNFENVFVMKSF